MTYMVRLTKKYNEHTETYEYIDAFSGAGIFDTIIKRVTSKFVKDTAKTVGTKALEAGVNKFGSEIGTRAANKFISVVDIKFSKPHPKSLIESHDSINPHSPKVIEIVEVESSKPLGNIIMKELNKKSLTSDNLTSPENSNAFKKQYYGYGASNKQFQSKLNKLLK